MKRIKFLLTALIFTMLFAGSAMAAESQDLSNKTALFLVEKSNEAMVDVTSMSMKGYMDMALKMAMLGEVLDEQVDMDIEALIDMPEKMYMKYTMDLLGEKVDTEMYITEDGTFMKMPIYSDEWEEVYDGGMMAEIMAMAAEGGNELAGDMLAEMGMDYVGLAENINSNYRYNKNVRIGDECFYVVEFSMDIKALLKDCRDVVYQTYVVMEEQLAEYEDIYEGYADEAIAAYDQIIAATKGTVEMEMYINKDTYYTEYTKMLMDFSIVLEEYEGMSIDLKIDGAFDCDDFNSDSLPFPEM